METKYQVFRELEKTFDEKDLLDPTATSLSRQIFTNANEILDQTDIAALKAWFATTHYANVVYMIQY